MREWRIPLGLLVSLLSCAANATLITYEFSGTLSFVDDPDNLLPDSIVVGNSFTGVATVDAGAPVHKLTNPTNPSIYLLEEGSFSFSTDIGGTVLSASPDSVGGVGVNDAADNWFVTYTQTQPTTPSPYLIPVFALLDSTGSRFSTEDLVYMTSTTGFDGAAFLINEQFGVPGNPDNSDPTIRTVAFGSVSLANVKITEVPEPGTLSLFAAGLLALGIARKRRLGQILRGPQLGSAA